MVLAGESSVKGPEPKGCVLKIQGAVFKQRLQELGREASGHYGALFLHGLGHNAQIGPDYAVDVEGDMFNGRKTSIYGGSNEVQRTIIAGTILGLRG